MAQAATVKTGDVAAVVGVVAVNALPDKPRKAAACKVHPHPASPPKLHRHVRAVLNPKVKAAVTVIRAHRLCPARVAVCGSRMQTLQPRPVRLRHLQNMQARHRHR